MSGRLVLLFTQVFALATTSFAAAPTLEHLFPTGAARGSTNVVALSGKADPWPARVWTDAPGLSFVAETNQNRFRVEVAADAAPGPRLVRLFNEDGASEPRFFVVGAGPEVADAEPNNHFGSPQVLGQVPVTINGRLDKSGDVDSFAVRMRAGQWLDARLDAYVLMSKVDGVLRLVDTNGVQLAWNHDDATLDPRLTWRAPGDASVVVQVFGFRHPADSSIVLAGGESAVYRLHLNVVDRPPDLPGGWPEESGTDPAPEAGGALVLEPPATVWGTLSRPREIDRYRFLAPTSGILLAAIDAAGLGSPLDAWLAIEDPAGKELARVDDAEGSRDPRLEWKPPGGTNAVFVAAVGSLTHRGGPAYRYRLSLQPAGPAIEANLDTGSVVLAPGTTNTVKVRVRRLRGHTNAVTAFLRDLPTGVMGAPRTLEPSDTEPVLELVAAADAAAFQGPVRVVLAETNEGAETAVPFELTTRGENNGVPQGYSRLVVDRTDRLWLTVRTNRPAAAPAGDGK